MAINDQHETPNVSEEVVQLPAPTAWPLVLALGLTFAFAGLVTNMGISVLGAVLIVALLLMVAFAEWQYSRRHDTSAL